jgi:seryl-tRNA synthetase/acyl carrier protein
VLNRDELEQRLLRFVRRDLVSSEIAARVLPDTRLFEERIVDSLKILELIAFLEAATVQKIPDRQVVLANFASVEAMAKAFSTTAESAHPARIFENSRAGRFYSDSAILAEHGVVQTDDGGIELHGAALALAEYLDAQVVQWARELGAVEELFADTIAVKTLERAGFIKAFPQKLVRIDGDDDYALPPAVCYHHYPYLANQIIDERGSIITAVGRCFRDEHDDAHAIERLRSFMMREIVAVGGAAFVEEMRAGLIDRVRKWIVALDLDGVIETASDPFFTSESRGRLLMQQVQPLKYELRLKVSGDGRSIAAASFNNHQTHFGRSFSIRQPGGEFAHSGCVAFGWERWVIAFVAQHGLREDDWPIQVRSSHAVAF